MYSTITYFAKYLRRFKDWAMDNLGAIGPVAGFAIIVAGAVLLAMGSTPISGTVVEKTYTPAQSVYRYGYSCDSGTCKNENYYDYQPARWTIVVNDCTEECKYKVRDVPESVYHTLKVGQHYDSEDY